MLKHPTLKPHLRAQVAEGEGVFLLSETRQTFLQGRLFEEVLPRLRGQTVEELCREIGSDIPPSQVIYTLRKLQRRGYLCERDESRPESEAALWAMQDIDPAAAARRLESTPVALQGFGVETGPLAALLDCLGVQVAGDDDPATADLGVVLCDHYLNRNLPEYNRAALESGRPWMLAKPFGSVIWLGPVFVPGETPCWECMAMRIRANSPVLGYFDERFADQPLPRIDTAATAATLSIAWGMIGNQVAGWVAAEGESHLLEGQLQTLDTLTLESQSHAVIQQPACPACGEPQQAAATEPPPLVLESRQKIVTDDGGHRAVLPQHTIAQYEHLVSPVCGAVTMLERTSPAGDGVMHVYVSGHNVARGPQSLFGLQVDLRNESAGKGITELQAKASALCEGLERYSGLFRGDEPRRKARLVDLGDAGIHPNDCMLFSDRQYAEREERNDSASSYGYIPLPFDPEAEIDWSPVWSLTHERVRYLPTQFCYFGYPHDCDQDFCVDCSNGNAAGNTLEEAVLQGLFELVERDGVSLWWYNRVQRPAVELESFGVPYLAQLQEYLASRNRELWALDLTSDLGIPVIASVSRRTDGGQEQLMFGFGAHLDARIALLRSVTELNQMLVPILDSPAEGPPTGINDEETVHWLETATLENQPHLVPAAETRTAAQLTKQWSDDMREDIMICRSLLEQRGLEMLVLDQTRPEIGMPVVKTIVPGMRHFWTRFAPGRLYDVPVELGWLERPNKEEELNPIAMFL